MIHAVLGPVQAADLLHEAKWAVRAYQASKDQPPSAQQALLAAAHASRLSAGSGIWPKSGGSRQIISSQHFRPLNKQQRLHDFLAKNPLPPGDSVFVHVFRDLLGEPIDPIAIAEGLRREKGSQEPQTVVQDRAVKSAKSNVRPSTVPRSHVALPGDAERTARGRLHLALQLLESDPAAGRKWLRQVCQKYPGTAAADEAGSVLMVHGE